MFLETGLGEGLGETRRCVARQARGASVSNNFEFLVDFHYSSYSSIETRKNVFYVHY